MTISILGITLFFMAMMSSAGGANEKPTSSQVTPTLTHIPDYFQTSPEVLPGPTKTGGAPFLAQTDPVPTVDGIFKPHSPLQTNLAISGNANQSNIFHLMGHLSPYFANPSGFGAEEYPLPPGAQITTAHLLSRHGSRYPTDESSVSGFGEQVRTLGLAGNKWTGPLAFLNDWKYELGAEILVARGREELFSSGILFNYNYGHLADAAGKMIARTTSQDRMLKSAEYFMTGFFGLDWTENVTLVPILEAPGLNNSLAGYYQCENGRVHATAGTKASQLWQSIYLANATERLREFSGTREWSLTDSYNAQTLCPYETVAFGYSRFCELFTYEEWEGFEYSVDLVFQGNDGWMSPVGRAIGIGYVEELYARLRGKLYDLPPGATNVNRTLDTMTETFPLNQPLYMDFSHDTNIYSILTAMGLKQFGDVLSNTTTTPHRNVTVSHITPFAARVIWEQITAPSPVKAKRPARNAADSEYFDDGKETRYIHMTINQRTIPFGQSYPECGDRDDGWCELDTFLGILGGLLDQAQYEYSCFGDYKDADWGDLTNGAPL